jgi:hypothetical protein
MIYFQERRIAFFFQNDVELARDNYTMKSLFKYDSNDSICDHFAKMYNSDSVFGKIDRMYVRKRQDFAATFFLVICTVIMLFQRCINFILDFCLKRRDLR